MCWSLYVFGLLLLYHFFRKDEGETPAPRWEEDDPYLMALMIEEEWDEEEMYD